MCALNCAYCGADWWHLNAASSVIEPTTSTTSTISATNFISAPRLRHCNILRNPLHMRYEKAQSCGEEQKEKIALWEGEDYGGMCWTDLMKKYGWNVSFGGREAVVNLLLSRRLNLYDCAKPNLNTIRPNEHHPLVLSNLYPEDEWIECLYVNQSESSASLTRPQCWLADWYIRNAYLHQTKRDEKNFKPKLRQLLKAGCEDQLYRPPYTTAIHASQQIVEQEDLRTSNGPWQVGDVLLCREYLVYIPCLTMGADGIVVVRGSPPRVYMDRVPIEAVVTDIAMGIDGVTPCVRIHYSKWSSGWDEWIYINSSRLLPWPEGKAKPLDLTLSLITLIEATWPGMRAYIDEVLHEISTEYRFVYKELDAASGLPDVLLLLIMKYTLLTASASSFRQGSYP